MDAQFDADPAPDPDFSLRSLETIEADIAAVARAIERLDDGSYGSCERCGSAIDPDVQLERPLLTRCSAHEADQLELAEA